MDIECLLKGTSCDWRPHYAGLKCEGKITVASASPCVRVDLACLWDVPFFPQCSIRDLLEGGWPFQMEEVLCHSRVSEFL